MPEPTTVLTRERIGFPDNRSAWLEAAAVYDDHSLRIAGHPIMESWEAEYMTRLAEVAASRGGHVLEVGYGLGLSAAAIQKHPIQTQCLIEFHPQVVARCIEENAEAITANRLHILTGFWEDITPLLRSGLFDGILFDTYPLNAEQIHSNHFWFFEEAFRLLKPGGTLTYYSDEPRCFSPGHLDRLRAAGFLAENIRGEICPVHPPEDCEYWQEKTLLIPIITK